MTDAERLVAVANLTRAAADYIRALEAARDAAYAEGWRVCAAEAEAAYRALDAERDKWQALALGCAEANTAFAARLAALIEKWDQRYATAHGVEGTCADDLRALVRSYQLGGTP